MIRPTSSPWLAPRNAHTRVRERAAFENSMAQAERGSAARDF
jgi:hypothetical protein